jgi:7-carboxy-7-deazaguanine synthase
MQIVEIFRSIQGEGTRTGEPTTFVRLAGCNLHCTWCDTPYAQGGTGVERSIPQIVAEVAASGPGLVCVTGGEPLLQVATPDLVRALLSVGRGVQVMTNGSLLLHAIPLAATLAVDIKTPWSHESVDSAIPAGRAPDRGDLPAPPHFDLANLRRLSKPDEVKFVVRDRREFEWAALWADRVGLFDTVGTVLVGAAWDELDAATVADWILESRLPIRLNVQLHKMLWGTGTRR